jgi:DNA-binding MarR family transcriptional regulator
MSTEQSIINIDKGFDLSVRRARLPILDERVRRESGVDISTSVYRVLEDLADMGPTRISDLAVAGGLDVSTMSRTVKQLQERGFISRRQGKDKRLALIELSSEGEWAMQRVRAARRRALSRALADWNERDREHLGRLLLVLADSILDYANTPTDLDDLDDEDREPRRASSDR